MTEKKEERWIPVHKIVVRFLAEDPLIYAVTIARIYIEGGKVPSNDIQELIMAFESTLKILWEWEDSDKIIIRRAIETLKIQKAEQEAAKRKIREKELEYVDTQTEAFPGLFD